MIKKIKPTKLYVAADGPRLDIENEKKLCEETREIISNIDWPCELKTLYREKNLGCKIGVSSAINWFFQNVEEGIILEDDCLPNINFFKFCQDLLEKYRNNNNILIISGTTFLPPEKKYDYYFTNIPHIWGWATWKRTWDMYDVAMQDFPSFKKEKLIKNIWREKKYQLFWLEIFNEVYLGKINTWDYQLSYTCWKNKKISISPEINLISNIGFDNEATHTKDKNDPKANLKTDNIIFPLKHPNTIISDQKRDGEMMKIILPNKNFLTKYIIKEILRKIGLFSIIKKLKNHENS
jgi:hypothetical protein